MTAPTPAQPADGVAPAENVPAETTPGAPPAAPAPPAQQQQVASPAQMPQAQPPAADVDNDDDGGDTESPDIRKVRREAKSLRDRLKAEQEAREALAAQVAELAGVKDKASELEGTLAKLAAVFNPAAAEEPVDPAKLAEQLAAEKEAAEQAAAAAVAERDAQLRQLKVEQAAERAARAAGVEADALLDSRTFAATVAKLDPASDTFKADLESAIQAAVAANPKLKTAPVATRSGAEIAGRSGAPDQITLDQLKTMKPDEIEAARKRGQLRSLGIG